MKKILVVDDDVKGGMAVGETAAALGHAATRFALPSLRGRRVARHKGESFLEMALRLNGNVTVRGRQ